MLRRILGSLGRGAFRPDLLPADVVMGVALIPPLLAGLLFFHVAAAVILAIGVGAGAVAHLAARLAGQAVPVSPVLPAILAVALVGPAAPLAWVAVVAAAAAVLELARARWLEGARLDTGILAYALIFLSGHGILGAYVNPGTTRPLAEPIRLWETYFGSSALPFDAVKLYVGNVPGPVFATSLLAVAAGAAWLWYSRRLSLSVLIGFAVGAALPIAAHRWNAGFQLDSGPAWLAVVYVLADRRRLPGLGAARPLVGMAVGVLAVGLRARGQGIEMVFLAVAALQLILVTFEGCRWLMSERERVWDRSREATARLWKGARALPAGRRAA